ncbi:MAG: dihydropteroate synthase, partial [Thermoplasmatota archaeon]
MRRIESFSISKASLEAIGRVPVPEMFTDLEPPVVMGILNYTPDSFSDGGIHNEPETAVERIIDMVVQGAGIVDIGGESTRPFAEPVPHEVELRRTIPLIEEVVDRVDVPVSIDTRHAEVAARAIEAGEMQDIDALCPHVPPEFRRAIRRLTMPRIEDRTPHAMVF